MGNIHMRGQHANTASAKAPETVPRSDLLIAGAAWHSSSVERYGSETQYLAAAAREHEALKLSLDSLETMRQTPDPRMTTAGHFDAVNSKADEMLQKIQERQETALNTGIQEAMKLRQKINDQTILHENSHSAEIRGRLAAMPQEERRALLDEAVETGQPELVAAVVKAPAMLSGMEQAEADGLRRQYVQKHAGELLGVLDAVNKSNDHLMAAYEQAQVWLKRVQNHDHDGHSQKAEAAAQAAGFNAGGTGE